MGLVNINQICPGMVLADDLRDSMGRFLLPGGIDLTEKHIRILKMWGVVEAKITDTDTDDDIALDEIDPALVEMAEQVTRKRFVYSGVDHPVTRELFRFSTLRNVQEMNTDQDERQSTPQDCDEGEMDIGVGAIPPGTTIDFHTLIRRHILELPTLPRIFLKMNEIIAMPNSSANDIAGVISKDTSLSARILRIVNSAFYGFPSRIDSVSRAVAIIGTRQLGTLASGVTIVNMFSGIPSTIVDMKSFWKHSIACGVHARIIAGYHGIQNTERLFLSGLLHDIGRLILYNYTPGHAAHALAAARRDQRMLRDIEDEALDFDHAEIGGLLLEKWRLPTLIEHAVRYHHSPRESQYPLEPSIVHLADIMANAVGAGSSGERFVPPLDLYAWDSIGLSANALDVIMKQANRHIEELVSFFYTDES